MTTVHLKLATLLAQQARVDDILTTRQLRHWYASAHGSSERLLPAQHALGADGQPPVCAACQKQPLLEQILLPGRKQPHYRVCVATPSPPALTDHARLKVVLADLAGEILSLKALRTQLLRRRSAGETVRESLLKGLHRHAEGGECKACQDEGYLLRRTGREQYQVLPTPGGPTLESRLQALSVPLPLLLVWYGRDFGPAGTQRPLLDWLSQQLSLPDSALQAALKTLHLPVSQPWTAESLMLTLWQSPQLADWQSWEGIYLRQISQPLLEYVLQETLPWRFAHAPETIAARNCLRHFLSWRLGGRAALTREDQTRLAQLALAGDELSAQFLALAAPDLTPAEQLDRAAALPGFEGDYALATGLLALLRPQQFMTVSPPLYWALQALAQAGQIVLACLDKPFAALTATDMLDLQAWAEQICRVRNREWHSDWLTPRRLDRCLAIVREGLPLSLVDALSEKSTRRSPALTTQAIQALLEELYGAFLLREFRQVRRAAREWRHLPPLPAALTHPETR
jgi:hypothetical protein